MASAIEEKLINCKKCKKKTIHQRNSSRTSFIMMLIHIALIIATAGVWLVLLIIAKILSVKIGGWQCSEC